ncbi:LD-carboxypeptidase [Aureibaculum sp. 2210JD6-5]|uniref:S66 peptidase family protein n=1 Tax=Aureibaculum sp. 2210JD6-5 TaxID=3103957 RepID=UPI002AAD17F3|nr:LD-carboxypeptidase [Aureibaculum sp. 2210JD6-5]MDY7395929.1 LD-carboxypeptidase [Aureibaculum sp. 2210JD6-5]
MKKFFSIIILFSISSVCLGQNDTDKSMTKPPSLQKGDTVMILAPAGIVKDTIGVENGIALLKKWGLSVKLGKNLFNQHFKFAGTDAERLADFQNALDDDNIKAIWCARGGYGAIRILDDLDFTKFKQNPKWIIGFSDITAFHNEIHKMGIETIHGIMPLTYKPDEKEQRYAIKSLKKAFFGKRVRYRVAESDYNREGDAEGVVVGGNLSLVYSMLGSKSQIDVSGKILYLEEVGEALYHIDRMMISLKRAGYFENCKGLIIGGMSNMKSEPSEFGMSYEEIILDAVKAYDFPVAFDFPAGHITDNRTIILGREVELKVKGSKTVVKFER